MQNKELSRALSPTQVICKPPHSPVPGKHPLYPLPLFSISLSPLTLVFCEPPQVTVHQRSVPSPSPGMPHDHSLHCGLQSENNEVHQRDPSDLVEVYLPLRGGRDIEVRGQTLEYPSTQNMTNCIMLHLQRLQSIARLWNDRALTTGWYAGSQSHA